MPSQCPHCKAEMLFPDNEFYIVCDQCKGGVDLDGSGNIRTNDVATSFSDKTAFVNAESLEDLEQEETVKEAGIADEVAPPEKTEIPDEAAPPETPDEVAPSEKTETPDETAPSDIEVDSAIEVTHLNQDSIEENTSSFSQDAGDFNSEYLYDLMISNIDSEKIQSDLLSILNDDRLKLDNESVKKQFIDNVSGRVSLKDLSALKISYIVQNIYNASISVDLYWEQRLEQ